MAIAYTMVSKLPDLRKTIVDITLDGAYSSGGYALTNSSLGMLAKPDMVTFNDKTVDGFVPQWDQANNKLKMFKSAGSAAALTECSSGDLSASVIIRAEVTGLPLI